MASRRHEQFHQRRIATNKRIKRDTIQRGIKRLRRICDGQFQTARMNQRTGVIDIRKTFRQRHIGLQKAKYIPDHDVSGRPAKRNATTPPALRVQEIQLRKTVDHLRKMTFRGIAALRNLGLGHQPVGIRRAEHQHADRDIRAFGNAHDGTPCLLEPARNCLQKRHIDMT